MSELNQTKEKIQNFFKKRLMYQYKKDSWQKTISEFLEAELNQFKETLLYQYNKIHVTDRNEQIKALEKKYLNHIPKPSTGLGTRLKFLFTGRF